MSGRRILAIALGVVVLAVLVWLGTRSPARSPIAQATLNSSPPAPSTSTVPPSVITLDAAPGTSDLPVPGGDDRSEQGARHAAFRFLELTEEVVHLSPEAGAELQRSISTALAADGLAADVFDQLTTIAAEVPEGVAIEVAPIGVSSMQRGDGWDVAVWYVEVIVYGDQLAVEQWRTATYSLEWENGGWRMSALTSAVGPVPTRPASVLSSPTQAVSAAVESMSDEEVGS